METLAHANPSQHSSLSGWDEAPCNEGSIVYNLYKPGIWLINPEQGPSCLSGILPWGDAGKLQKKIIRSLA